MLHGLIGEKKLKDLNAGKYMFQDVKCWRSSRLTEYF